MYRLSLFASIFPYCKQKSTYTCCLYEVHSVLKEKSCQYKQLFSCSAHTVTATVASPQQCSYQCARSLKRLARTSGFLSQRRNSRSGRVFLGCTHGRRKKRTFCSRSGAVCKLHMHEALAPSQHVLRPYSSRNLDVARRIYNYRLTWARRILLCAFGIVCNKWRSFHGEIDVCPDFCDVAVQNLLHTTQLCSSEKWLSVSGYFIRMSPREY